MQRYIDLEVDKINKSGLNFKVSDEQDRSFMQLMIQSGQNILISKTLEQEL